MNLYDEIDLEKIDLNSLPPEIEPARQYYFIAKCRQYVKVFEKENGRLPSACVFNMGCQMNARDSEKLKGILEAIGYCSVEDEKADLVIYNTCTVRDNANQKVYGHLGYMKNHKKQNPHMLIALCGCMMQEQVVIDKIKKSYQFVDLVFGTHNVYKLAELLYQRLSGDGMVIEILKDADHSVEELPANRKYSFKSGVNIMYGCDNYCSYCIVPYVRGRERSRDPEEILEEVRRLAADGVVEIMLLGQNVNSYGKKFEKEEVQKPSMTFAQLLREVEKIEGIQRIRFMTSHPKDLSDELIQVMKESKKICRHLHLPLQSGSSRILKLMNRHYDKEKYISLAEKIKREIPDISLTTDIIVGFPGETEEDFQETLDVVRQVRYDSAFTFIYSIRTGTPAAKMEQVPEAVSKERFGRLLALVQQIAAQECGRHQGQTMDVLVESEGSEPGMVTGRLSNNTVVHLKGNSRLIGSIVPVKLEESHGFYYIGKLAEEAFAEEI